MSGRVFDVLAMGRSSIDLYAHQIGVPHNLYQGFRQFSSKTSGRIAIEGTF